MARPIRVIVNVGRLPSIPARIERAQLETVQGVGEGLAEAVGNASRSSQIKAATHAAQAGPNKVNVVIGEGVPFALIRDRGGSIRPVKGKVLRFADGEFRPYARQRGIGYVAAGAAEFGRVTGEQFHEAFGTL